MKIILTATNRLATYLRYQYDKTQQSAGKLVWETPNILPLNTWIRKTWNETGDTRVVLTTNQANLLWQRIIAASPAGQFLPVEKTAKLAQQTWYLMHHYPIELDGLLHHSSQDIHIFATWAQEFKQLCVEKNCITQEELPNQLTSKMNELSLADEIELAGFDEFTFSINKLVDKLKVKCGVRIAPLFKRADSIERITVSDPEKEIEKMALFAKTCWEKNPNAQIGCIVPQLLSKRHRIVDCFQQVFGEAVPYNIAGGKTLTSFPIIRTALDILILNNQYIKTDLLSNLLLSPYLHDGSQEFTQRAILDLTIRERAESRITLRQILAFARKQGCGKLVEPLNGFVKNKAPSKQTPSQWSTHFAKQLEAIGWPGERSLNSEERQCLARFQTLLEEFAMLELVQKTMTFQDAWQRLQRLANNVLFQVETPVDLPIQVLGSLEAAGLYFDHCWVTGLNASNWPASPSPNPFISLQIQKQFNMPHASAEIETEYAKTLTERFCHSADHVIFSHTNQIDGEVSSPSILIKNFPETSLALPSSPTPAEKIFLNKVILESVIDDDAPSVSQNEKIRGGTSIFQAQANCPFQAYAKVRLKAESVPQPVEGLNAAERGSIVHAALATIWNQLKTHQNLIKLNSQAQADLIQAAISSALSEIIPDKPLTLTTKVREIEDIRLSQQLHNWLELEKKRPAFTVQATEQTHTTQIGEIKLNLRLDRIDQLESGEYLIIDYKTGKTSCSDWFGTRPTQPQLPIYAISSEQPISSITFAQIRADEVTFNGIAASELSIPNISQINDWSILQQQWQTNLTELANDFMQGKACVDPKDNKSCMYCDLHTLCRINDAHSVDGDKINDK